MDMMRVSTTFLLGALLCLVAAATYSQSAAESNYTEVFYPSGSLRIQAYLYKPAGNGPFPVVIYNHGSRAGREQRSVPFEYIGRLLTRAGYAVLVPERRGYGKSDGPVATATGGAVVARLQAEADDVLAALDYVRTLPFVAPKRIGIMGWSFGGIVTMFAVSRSTEFVVAVDQAGGALSWKGNSAVRSALTDAAEKSTTPTLFLVAENDATTDSITTLAEIYKKRGVPHRMVIYQPFMSENRDVSRAPGHKVFSVEGVNVWEKDVLEFLGRYLGATSTGAPGSVDPAKLRQ
jgi:dienelactone hydrolase